MGWNDLPQNAASSGGGNSEDRVPFLKIGTEVIVRMLSEPEIYMKHFTFTITGKQTVIRCPGREGCLVCHREGKPKVRAMFLVLDRTDGIVKLYDAPQTVAAQIKSLMGVWGDLAQYDLMIKKLGSTKRTDYQVIAMPKAPLTQGDVDKIRLVTQSFSLKTATRPHTPEEINAILSEQPLPNRNAAPGQAANAANAAAQSGAAGFTKYGAPPAAPAVAPSTYVPPAAPIPGQAPIPQAAPQSQPVQPSPGALSGVNTYSAPNAPAGGTNQQGPTKSVSSAADAGYFNNFL